MVADVLLDLCLVLGAQQADGRFRQQLIERDAVYQIERIERVALGLRHLLAFGVAHDSVDVNVMERHFLGEVQRHHDHPSDPEEDDVEAGDQHRGRQEQVEVFGFFRPAERGERHQRRGKPGIEHVWIAGKFFASSFLSRFFFVACDVHVAFVVVPRGNLVSPPKLARDAPVLDILEPLVVGRCPVPGKKFHFALFRGLQPQLREAIHFHEPLIGKHRLDNFSGASRARHSQQVGLLRDQQLLRLQVCEHALARLEAVEASVGWRRVVIELGFKRENVDLRQAVPLAHCIVVEIVRRSDFHAAGAEYRVHVFIGDHGNGAAGKR